MVPSDGSVFTPVTKLPTSGMPSCTVCLMPSAVQVMFATNAPIVPFEVAVSSQPHIVDVHLCLHALGVADLVARRLDVMFV